MFDAKAIEKEAGGGGGGGGGGWGGGEAWVERGKAGVRWSER